MDDAGRNILFYSVKEALPQLTAFLLGSLSGKLATNPYKSSELLRFAMKNNLFSSALGGFFSGQQGLSPMSMAFDGSTPLASAVASQFTASLVVAKQLLEAKALVDSADQKGNFPLHEACRAGNDPCTKLLLSHGKAAGNDVQRSCKMQKSRLGQFSEQQSWLFR